MATPHDWSRLNELQKLWRGKYGAAALEKLKRQNEDALLAWHISDLSAEWKARASIAAYLIDAGPRVRKGPR